MTAGPPVRAGARDVAPLSVDWTRCDGHGVCAALLPGVIARDDWGYPVINASAAAATGSAALNRVVTACPALALRRSDAHSGRSRE